MAHVQIDTLRFAQGGHVTPNWPQKIFKWISNGVLSDRLLYWVGWAGVVLTSQIVWKLAKTSQIFRKLSKYLSVLCVLSLISVKTFQLQLGILFVCTSMITKEHSVASMQSRVVPPSHSFGKTLYENWNDITIQQIQYEIGKLMHRCGTGNVSVHAAFVVEINDFYCTDLARLADTGSRFYLRK